MARSAAPTVSCVASVTGTGSEATPRISPCNNRLQRDTAVAHPLHNGDKLERGRRIDASRRRHHFSHPRTIGRMATATAQTSAPAAAGGAGPTRGPAATPPPPPLPPVRIRPHATRPRLARGGTPRDHPRVD